MYAGRRNCSGQPDFKTGPAECGLRNFLPNRTRAAQCARFPAGDEADLAKLVLDIVLVYIGSRSGIGGQ